MAPKPKPLNELGGIVCHGSRWRVYVRLGRATQVVGPSRDSRIEAEADRCAIRAAATREDVPRIMQRLSSATALPAVVEEIPVWPEGARQLGRRNCLKTWPVSTAVYLKVIEPMWADDVASGKKFFECVANKGPWNNMFKKLDLCDLFIVVVKGQGQVAAVGDVAHPAQVKETQRSALKAMLPPERHGALEVYLGGAASFDYVQFSRVFDCRGLGLFKVEFLGNVGLADPGVPPLGLLRPTIVDLQLLSTLA